jgi:hypothetical protein
VGRSVEVDPGFGYYAARSPESVARELEVNGCKVVRYVVTNDEDVDDKLIAAFHSRGIAVWYCTFTNGFYGDPKGLPAGWESWKQVLYKPTDYGYTFLSLSSPEYMAWKSAKVVATLEQHAFDAVDLVEPFQVNWGGPDDGGYGDLSVPALAEFSKTTGNPQPPEFGDAASPRYWKTNKALYQSWVDFRAKAVTDFLTTVCNSIRKAGVKKPICVWALANTPPTANQDPVALAREWQGVDAGDIAAKAKPDLVCFQTNWPDWSTPDLPADYVLRYKPFVDQLRKVSKVPFIVQADTGSNADTRRSRQWIADFEKACAKLGAVGTTAYSYEISLWLFTEAPEVRQVEVNGDDVLLVFQKRLDNASAEDLSHYAFSGGLSVTRAACDGNLVRLTVSGLKPGTWSLKIDGVKDDVSHLGFKDHQPNVCTQTVKVVVRG